MNALVLVDVQNDFLPGGALAVPKGDEIIPVINALQSQFDLVVATQDWHPQNHGSFASNHSGKEPFEKIDLNGLVQILWPDHCVQGSTGAEFSDALDTKPVEAIFRKGTDPGIDSYSGFFDNGQKKATGLDAYLKGRNATTVTVAGLAGDFCVAYTAQDALALGFQTTIIKNATRSLDDANFETFLAEFMRKGGRAIDSL